MLAKVFGFEVYIGWDRVGAVRFDGWTHGTARHVRLGRVLVIVESVKARTAAEHRRRVHERALRLASEGLAAITAPAPRSIGRATSGARRVGALVLAVFALVLWAAHTAKAVSGEVATFCAAERIAGLDMVKDADGSWCIDVVLPDAVDVDAVIAHDVAGV